MITLTSVAVNVRGRWPCVVCENRPKTAKFGRMHGSALRDRNQDRYDHAAGSALSTQRSTAARPTTQKVVLHRDRPTHGRP